MTRRRRTTDRDGFTLIELLVIIAIIGIMVTVGVVSLTAGKGAARVKGATRDIFGAIRNARSTALVTGKPAVITYSTVEGDGEPMAKIEVHSAKLFDSGVDRSKVETLSGLDKRGKIQAVGSDKAVETKAAVASAETDETPAPEEKGGESVEEILFAPINEDIVRGMRLKVQVGDEMETSVAPARKSKVSVFSNVDYLIGRFKEARAAAQKEEKAKSAETGADSASPTAETQEPVSVVWETNGRVEPHQVWVYADGKRPEDGLLIRIDRFGAAKVLSGDGRED